jgi:hypothetical protein
MTWAMPMRRTQTETSGRPKTNRLHTLITLLSVGFFSFPLTIIRITCIIVSMMRYTLITPTGKVYTFHLQAVAETYLAAYGGTLITPTTGKVISESALH